MNNSIKKFSCPEAEVYSRRGAFYIQHQKIKTKRSVSIMEKSKQTQAEKLQIKLDKLMHNR
jgi:hypothetical protein